MKKYTVAVIGCGWIGLGAQLDPLRIAPASHAQAATMYRRTSLAALADTDRRSLARAKQLYPDVPRFSDIARMLVTVQPDIVIIATSPESHCALVRLAAKHRVQAILCEKPIAHDVQEAREAIRACRTYRVPLFVNHSRRFDPWIRKFRENLRGGYVRDTFLGPVRMAVASYDKGLYHGGTHFIDLLRYFLGNVRWVSAVPSTVYPRDPHDVRVDALLGFDGATAALQYFDSAQYSLSEMSFFGEKGRMNLKHESGLTIEIIGTRASDEYSSYRELNDERVKRVGPPRSFLTPVLPHIVDCLEGRDVPVSTGEDALRVLMVIRALEQSAQKDGKRVVLRNG
ncbi:MAG: Gfo/Idh/MocA family oxidoreductase [bacterium]|nr:Gfo/Idh/MocA family oxidoreductase [bacterium]